ncbi:hypothetical protein V6N13_085419 [Hibiscus sabdariffa]|uniref:Uncharacterized protein n=1 Tax=Hibiscus sabdariffa TaxID=183260 RepID=A0ABR2D1I1_9ROSI
MILEEASLPRLGLQFANSQFSLLLKVGNFDFLGSSYPAASSRFCSYPNSFCCCLQMPAASVTAPLWPSLSQGHGLDPRINRSRRCGAVRIPRRIQLRRLGLQLQPIVGRHRNQSLSIVCAAATLNATCSVSGQTQTVTREAPTITQAPVHSKEKSPQLDDGDSGFPPRDDDGGGGGGGGGGGNWSGGFFLFGFLAFLGFLKDKESEEDYRDSRRR